MPSRLKRFLVQFTFDFDELQVLAVGKQADAVEPVVAKHRSVSARKVSDPILARDPRQSSAGWNDVTISPSESGSPLFMAAERIGCDAADWKQRHAGLVQNDDYASTQNIRSALICARTLSQICRSSDICNVTVACRKSAGEGRV